MRLLPIKKEWAVALAIAVVFSVLLSTGHAGLYLPAQAVGSDGAVRKGDPSRPQVALMFNVDWGEEYIPDILDALDAPGAKATFFVTGKWAEKNPDLIREMHGRGHEIGNHGYRHAHVASLSPSEVTELIEENRELLRALIETDPAPLFAPPYGECSTAIVNSAAQIGYRTVLWSLDTIDWRRPPASTIVDRVSKAEAGDLVLLHPTRPTLAALSTILSQLQERGLKAVTVTQVLIDAQEK